MANRLKYWSSSLNIECACSSGDWVRFKNGTCSDYLKKIIRAYQWKFSRFSISMWRKSFKDGVGSINFLSSQKTFFFSSIHCCIWIYGSVSGSIQFLPMSDSDEDMIESAEVSFVISTIKIALRPCVFGIRNDVENTGWEFTR